MASRYQRVTFEIERIGGDTDARADLLAPGHPLHDAVMAETGRSLSVALEHGTVLVSPTAERVQVLVGVLEEIVDATETLVARRFGYALIDERGTVTDAGPAPYWTGSAHPRISACRRLLAGSSTPRPRRLAG